MTVPGGRNVVGSVYARLVAEGDGLDKSIDDALERQAKKFETSGKRYGELQSKGYRDALERDDPGEAILQLIDARRGDARSAGAAFGDQFTEGLRQRFGRQLGDIIDRNFRQQLERRGVAAVLRSPFETIMSASDEATRQVENDARRVESAIERQSRAWESYGQNLLTTQRREARLRDDDALSTYAHNIEVAARNAGGTIGRLNRLLDRAAQGARRTSVSNPFPRSRWLRPVGELISLGSRIPELLLKGAGAALDLASAVGKVFANGPGQAFSTGLGKIPGLLSSAAGAALGLAGGIVAVLAVAGLLAAALALLIPLIVNLTAVLVALASAVVAGLIGALGAALPIVVALGPAVAGIAIAVLSSKDAFKDASKPVVDWYNSIKAPITGNILGAYKSLMSGISGLITGENGGPLGDLMINSSAAVKTGTEEIIKSLTAPAFLESIKTLGGAEGLPSLIAPMMSAAANFFTGLTGLLVPLLGPAKDLAGWIQDISTRFTIFANSSEGQSKLAEWFDRAWESAKKLGSFLGGLFKVIGDIVNAGQGTGNGFLDSINDALGKFSQFVREGGLTDFFQRAVQFVGPLGDALKGIGGFVAAINTPENQQRLNSFLEWLERVLPPIGDFISKLADVGGAIIGVADKLGGIGSTLFAPVSAALDVLTGDFSGAWETIKSAFIDPFLDLGSDIVDGIKGGWDKAWGAFKDWWKGIWEGLIDAVKAIFGIHSPSTVFMEIGIDIIQGLWDGAVSLFTSVLDWFTKIPGMLIGALGDAGQLLVGWISDALNGMFNFIKGFFSAGGALLSFLAGVPGLMVAALGDIAGKIAAPFEAAARRISGAFSSSFEDVFGEMNALIQKANSIGGSGLASQAGGGILGTARANLGAGLMSGGFIGNTPMIYRGHPIFERNLQEVVLPTQLPLNQVNPEVREMARAARAVMNGRSSKYEHDSRPNVIYDFDVTTTAADPKAAAAQMMAWLPAARP